jgi:hypothetical protein
VEAMTSLPIEYSYRSLSLRDVLDARDAYHVHLLNHPNVLATAVGRYLVRREEADQGTQTAESRDKAQPGSNGPRTLEGSCVQPWSWPCVLVFVDAWMTEEQVADNPGALVPRRLYLQDGRVVPTCVVYAPPADRHDPLEPSLSFPSGLVGGGYACLSDVQGRTRVGSIACLVTDGDRTYALTNRHVAGVAGRELSTMVDGRSVKLGRTTELSVVRRRFTDVYPDFSGARMELAIDAGLIEFDDLDQWTTQVYGIGLLGEMLDVSQESLSLDLVGCPLDAFGAASGKLEGEVVALFYRYRTVGGVEYVADVLIGPRGPAPLRTQPGDSGTLWVIREGGEPEPGVVPVVRPVAMQWGGHVFVRGASRETSPYALGSFLSNVCRALDVELVRDWNTGHDLYWGEAGHYTVGAKACELVAPDDLRDFFQANVENISFDLAAIADKKYQTPAGTTFYPLADVPDRVWRRRKGMPGRNHEGPNHFADLDEPNPAGETLLARFRADPQSVTPARWLAFYQSLDPAPAQKHMGLAPFRVAQLYHEMLTSLKAGDAAGVVDAVAAGGVMAHYVGDACQPLHSSRFHHGRDASEADVHEHFETDMITKKRSLVITQLGVALQGATPMKKVKGRRAAARAVVALMDRTFTRLDPEHVCEVWKQVDGDRDDLWDALGPQTIECLADGCRTLAMLWSSAWAEAKAPAPPPVALDRDALRDRYLNNAFVPSLFLPEFVQAGIW